MIKPLRNFIKQYLNFSKKDRRGTIILTALIFIVIAANVVVDKISPKPKSNFSEFQKAIEEWEQSLIKNDNSKLALFNFDPNTISELGLDSLNLPDFVKGNIINYRKANGRFKEVADLRKIYGMNDSIFNVVEKYIIISMPEKKAEKTKNSKHYISPSHFRGVIDPNIANYNELLDFGFNSFQANNIIGYRTKGGTFFIVDDLLKIYGIDSTSYDSLKSHVVISKISPNNSTDSKRDTPLIDINKADSLSLTRLKGIGAVYAARIIKYRLLLGGYYSKKQLLEVYNFPIETFEAIEDYIDVDTSDIKKIRINFANYKELLKHPYLNASQVKTIIEDRNRNGAFGSIQDIFNKNLIDSLAYTKIEPYLTIK